MESALSRKPTAASATTDYAAPKACRKNADNTALTRFIERYHARIFFVPDTHRVSAAGRITTPRLENMFNAGIAIKYNARYIRQILQPKIRFVLSKHSRTKRIFIA